MCVERSGSLKDGGRADKTNGANYKQLVKLGKGYIGVSYTIIEKSLQVSSYIKRVTKKKKANFIKFSQKFLFLLLQYSNFLLLKSQ